MKYLYEDEAAEFNTKNTAIALGKFDGIHMGHRLLIDGIINEKKNGKKALVFTFGRSLTNVLSGNEGKYIYTPLEKEYYFSKLSVDVLLEYPFTKEFASMDPEKFVKSCLVDKLGAKVIYVGEDFRFGKDRAGDALLLKELSDEYGFDLHVVKKKTYEDEIISSTLIREYLKSDFDKALKMLGEPYFVYGEVITGNKIGRTIGFPTINQKILNEKCIPSLGVYASNVYIDGKTYRGISNLGIKPTIDDEELVGLETHILGFEGDLYGRCLKTELLHFIRPEKKFDSIDDLKKQIDTDIKTALSRKNT